MNWAFLKNNKTIKLQDIPEAEFSALRESAIEKCKSGLRVIGFFNEESNPQKNQPAKVYMILADDENSRLEIASSFIKEKYQSLTPEIPAFNVFERELYENTGLMPEEHPWNKPVRYPFNRFDKNLKMENYPFFKQEGDEIHEVAVGPVHAGVIEPGHFRFMCNGEYVSHLEIQLGYQHRGVEDLFLKRPDKFQPHLAESIAGDTAAAHTAAYCSAMESLADKEISQRAEVIRGISLELERAGVHIGDLSAIANDVAYLAGNAIFGAIRTRVINSSLAICGSRFTRGLMRVGGVVFDINAEKCSSLVTELRKVKHEFEDIAEVMFSAASVLSRLQKTGIVTQKQAEEVGLVGLAARASGVRIDIRTDHPFGAYKYCPVYKNTLDNGDVFARSFIRYVETCQSLGYILEHLENLPEGEIYTETSSPLQPETLVVSMTEGWRGEVVHAAITDKEGKLKKYKVKDPSFNNWFGLALAVRNNEISDFPLCNKSFNLSYCGNDL